MNKALEAHELLDDLEDVPVLEGVTNAKELAEEFKKVMMKHMPASYGEAVFSTNLSPSVGVSFRWMKDKSKLSSGIAENDPAGHSWIVFGFDREGNFPEGKKLSMEIGRGGSLSVKPPEGSHLAQGRVKVGWRNKKGSPEQLVKHFDNYMKKLKKAIEDNKEDLVGLA